MSEQTTSGKIHSQICEYIVSHTGKTDLEFSYDIFGEGLVNSLFAIQLMTYIENTFEIKFTMDDLDWQNLKSVNAIADFIKLKQGQPVL